MGHERLGPHSAGNRLLNGVSRHALHRLHARKAAETADLGQDTVGSWVRGRKDGGRYWIRTSDPSDVNTVLYQLS